MKKEKKSANGDRVLDSSVTQTPKQNLKKPSILHRDVRFWAKEKNHQETLIHKEVNIPPIHRKVKESLHARRFKPGWSLSKKTINNMRTASFDEQSEQLEGSGSTAQIQAHNLVKSKGKKSKKIKTKRSFAHRFSHFALKSALVLIFAFLFSVLTLSGAVYAYKDQFEDKALFGTKIFGEDVGSKTKDEIQKILDKKLAGLTFSFAIDGTEVNVKPEEAGVTFQTKGSAAGAIEKGKDGDWYSPWFYSISSLAYKIYPDGAKKLDSRLDENLAIKYDINDEKLSGFTQSLSNKFNIESKNAGLVMSGTEVQVIPAVFGRKIVADSVKLQISEAVKNSSSSKISIQVEKVNPAILEEDTRQSIEAAKGLISIPVTYTYQGQKFVPDKGTIGSWIIFNTQDDSGKQKLVPAVDPTRVYSYVYGLAGKINIPAINKKVNIENGSTQTVTQEGKDGLAVDIDRASVTTAEGLNARKAVSLELPTYVVKYKTQVNNILVANWEKYIEINLSTQRLYAYTAGGNLVGSWSICSGKSGFATPTGTHLVLGKSSWIRMQGGWGTSEYYNLYPIKWATWFTGAGHAMHDAYWRSSFGYPASHGCINMPDDGAAFIYNWAPVGTPVVIHY